MWKMAEQHWRCTKRTGQRERTAGSEQSRKRPQTPQGQRIKRQHGEMNGTKEKPLEEEDRGRKADKIGEDQRQTAVGSERQAQTESHNTKQCGYNQIIKDLNNKNKHERH